MNAELTYVEKYNRWKENQKSSVNPKVFVHVEEDANTLKYRMDTYLLGH